MTGIIEEFERIADIFGFDLSRDEEGYYANRNTGNAFEFLRDGSEWQRQLYESLDWKLVPKKPTKKMREAFHKAHERFEDGRETDGSPDDEWRAMLRAAPKMETDQ